MGLAIKIIIVVLALTTLTDAFNSFLPWDKEVIYQWKALVMAGSLHPANYASQFELCGKIHIQAININETYARIDDLTYKLYNGITGGVQQAEELPVGELSQHVFQITYDSKGLVNSIVTSQHEKEFSRNIKKAIATIFQLPHSVITTPNVPSGFTEKELSIHGYSIADYVVVPQPEYVQVDKKYIFPEDHSQTAISHSSVKRYKIFERNGKHVVKYIEANGEMFYNPHQAKSDHQYLKVNQKFELVQTVKVQKQLTVESPGHRDSNLTYQAFEEAIEYQNIVPKIRGMLEEIWTYFQENHIHIEGPITEQLVNRVQRHLAKLEFDQLEQIQDSLTSNVDILNLFYHLLPIVGTQASTLLIKKLVVNKQISDEIALEILQYMSENIQPSVELVAEMEELIHLDNRILKNVATLNFAGLVGKLWKSETQLEKNNSDYIFTLLQKSLDDKPVYLDALFNIAHQAIIEQTITLIFDRENHQHSQRLQALRSLSSLLTSEGPCKEKVLKIYWQTLANLSEDIELRILAYYYIMESKPLNLQNIHWLVVQDTNQELYKFHYTYIETKRKQKTNDDHYNAKLNDIVLRPPKFGKSNANFFDFEDPIYGLRGEVQSFYITGPHSQLYRISVDEYVLYAIIRREEEVTLTFIKNGSVINTLCPHIIGYTGFDMGALFQDFIFSITKQPLHINYKVRKVTESTDLGILAMWEHLEPSVHALKLNITHYKFNSTINLEGEYANWNHYSHGLSFYNPIANNWQGINRYHSFDFKLPLRLYCQYELNRGINLQVSWVKNQDISGVRSHVKQVVFIRNDSKNDQYLTAPSNNYNNYELMNEDFENCQHNLYLAVFDSQHRVTNGTFKQILFQLWQADNKNYESPFIYVLMTIFNVNSYLLQLPQPGTHGFLLKMQPLGKNDITSINLSLKGSLFYGTNGYIYTPPIDFNAEITYAIMKNADVWKKWEIQYRFNFNAGHTNISSNLKIQQYLLGELNYETCVDGLMNWNHLVWMGDINMKMGDCAKDDSWVTLSLLGEISSEQKLPESVYGVCALSDAYYHSSKCIHAFSTVRNYVFTLKRRNVPSHLEYFAYHTFWEHIRGYYTFNHNRYNTTSSDLSANELRCHVFFSMEGNLVDISVKSSREEHTLTGVTTDFWKWFGVYSDSLIYPFAFTVLRELGLLEKCEINCKYLKFDDWKIALGSEDISFQFEVYVKKTAKGQMGVKIVEENKTLILEPLNVTIDGQAVQEIRNNYRDEWASWHTFDEPNAPRTVAIFMVKSGAHFEYDGQTLQILIPNMGIFWNGQCFNNN